MRVRITSPAVPVFEMLPPGAAAHLCGFVLEVLLLASAGRRRRLSEWRHEGEGVGGEGGLRGPILAAQADVAAAGEVAEAEELAEVCAAGADLGELEVALRDAHVRRNLFEDSVGVEVELRECVLGGRPVDRVRHILAEAHRRRLRAHWRRFGYDGERDWRALLEKQAILVEFGKVLHHAWTISCTMFGVYE